MVRGLVAEMLRTASLGVGLGLVTVMALVQAVAGIFPGIAAPGVGVYAVGTIIVLVPPTITAWVPSARTAPIAPVQALVRSEAGFGDKRK